MSKKGKTTNETNYYVCKHIKINFTKTKIDDSEYLDFLYIYCEICKKGFEFTLGIN